MLIGFQPQLKDLEIRHLEIKLWERGIEKQDYKRSNDPLGTSSLSLE